MLAEAMKSFELDSMKNHHMFESALDTFKIKCLEIAGLEEQGFFGESADDDIYLEAAGEFITKVKEFFKNLLKSIKDFINKIRTKISTEIATRKILKRIDIALENTAIDQASYEARCGDIPPSINDLVESYKKYAKACIAAWKTLYSKKYDNIEEYNAAVVKYCNFRDKLADDMMLSWHEKRNIGKNVDSALKMTKKEIENMDEAFRLVSDKVWADWQETLEKQALAEEEARRIQAAEAEARKQSNILTKLCSKIAQHPIKTASIILGAVGVTTGAVVGGKEIAKHIKAKAGSVSDVTNLIEG